MAHPHTIVVPAPSPTAWSRPLLPEPAVEAAGLPQVFVVLKLGDAWLEASHGAAIPVSNDLEWRAVDARLHTAAGGLEEVRDEQGALVELKGPFAGALTSKHFRKAALKRLGASEGLAVCPDGVELRLRDAWKRPASAQLKALADARLPGAAAVWVFDKNHVHSIIVDGTCYNAWGDSHPFAMGDEPHDASVLKDQVVFARALLAFMGGLMLAGALAALIAAL